MTSLTQSAELNKEITLNSAIAPVKTGKFPKSARLLKSAHYKYLHRNSNRLYGQTIIIQFQRGRSLSAKLGLTVSKKFGKAHERNRFKRVVREVFREIYSSLPSNFEMNISPQKSYEILSKQAMLLELKGMLDKILKVG